jgi:hypothetical protein
MLLHDRRWTSGNITIEAHPHDRALHRIWAYPADPHRRDVTVSATPSRPGDLTGKPVGKGQFVETVHSRETIPTGAWREHRIATLRRLGFRPSPHGQDRMWLLGYRDASELASVLRALADDDAPWATAFATVHWCQSQGIPAIDYQAEQRALIAEQISNWRAELDAFACSVAQEASAIDAEDKRERSALERLREWETGER